MIGVDTNLLVYAHRADSPFFEAASTCIRELAQSPSEWGLPWPCVHEFYGIATHLRRYSPPSTSAQAMLQIKEWLKSPSVRLIGETPHHLAQLESVVIAGRVAGGLIHDARIAAICLQHGVREFWTADRDFSRFPQLNCRNPLIA